jgi:hypothetical protein
VSGLDGIAPQAILYIIFIIIPVRMQTSQGLNCLRTGYAVELLTFTGMKLPTAQKLAKC